MRRIRLLALLTAAVMSLSACGSSAGGPNYSEEELLQELKQSGVDCDSARIETVSLAEEYNPIDFAEGEKLTEIECDVEGGSIQADVASSSDVFEAYRGVWCSENGGNIPYHLGRTGSDGLLVGGNWWLLLDSQNFGNTTLQKVLGGEILSLELCFDAPS